MFPPPWVTPPSCSRFRPGESEVRAAAQRPSKTSRLVSSAVLPIEPIRDDLLARLASGPVVLTATTGSGKSTQVPRWLGGRVVVVEPRRVACRALAARVAELEGSSLGAEVGFQVRDHRMTSADTRILFATPGIVLRRFDELSGCDTFILDEFHERSVEVDLILALLKARFRGQVLVMSATLRGPQIAEYLGGDHLDVPGREHPVAVSYQDAGKLLPDPGDLSRRVLQALRSIDEGAGDVLVFLPGKSEISAVQASLDGRTHLDVLPLHGGLSLEQQSRVFAPSNKRKVVLATNVAETSITLPGIGVVIDSGLVRRTRYHRGRGFLTLMSIADDSAQQRAGRAGRTGPGCCVRMWSEAARLEPNTPPEIRREALLPLVLAAAACGARVDELSFLDPPADYAVEAAQQEGQALGALDGAGQITTAGRQIFGLPLDAPLGRLLVEARHAGEGTLRDAIDLVAVLALGRPLFRSRPRIHDDGDCFRQAGCDATALVHALRRGDPSRHELNAHLLKEARSHARRLRRVFGLDANTDRDAMLDRESLARTAMRADPRCAHLARDRRRHVAWSNGGTEIELARESAVTIAEKPKAMVVYETRAFGVDSRKTRVMATCGSPVPIGWLAQEGLGRERVAAVRFDHGALSAVVERVFAKKVIGKRELSPQGAQAREALAQLLVDGKLFAATMKLAVGRLRDLALAARLGVYEGDELPAGKKPTLAAWLLKRLETLGVESGEDMQLLSEPDLLPAELSWDAREAVDHAFPKQLSTTYARYEVEVDLEHGYVILHWQDGQRGQLPTLAQLPRFAGFGIKVDTGTGFRQLRKAP